MSKKTAKTKSAGRSAPGNVSGGKRTQTKRTRKSEPQKDPEGGLTAAGRAAFRKKEGAHLRPGVKGKADTPEKQRRKGSFLRRHFAHLRGPLEKDGEPTRLALSAHAWGEAVPKSKAAAKKLAAKGTKLLERYKRSKETATAKTKSTGTTAKRKAASSGTKRRP